MSIIEMILKDLQSLPTAKLAEVARYVHSLSEIAHEERLSILRKTHGALSEEAVDNLSAPTHSDSIPWQTLKHELDERHR